MEQNRVTIVTFDQNRVTFVTFEQNRVTIVMSERQLLTNECRIVSCQVQILSNSYENTSIA